MRYYFRIIFVLFMIIIIVQACQYDSKPIHSSDISELFNQAHTDFLHQSNPDSALKIARLATDYGIQNADNPLIFESMIIGAYAYDQMQMNDSVRIIMNRMLRLAIDQNDSVYIASAYQMLAGTYIADSEIDSALIYLKEGLKISEHITNKKVLPALYTGLAEYMLKVNQYDSALIYYLDALNLYAQEKHSVNMASIYTGVSNVFADQGLADEAKKYIQLSIHINDSLDNNYGLISDYNNLGILLKNNCQYDSAAWYLNKAIYLSGKSGDTFGQIIETYNLGNVYSRMGQYEKAKTALNQVYDYSVEQNTSTGKIRALSGLAENEYSNGSLDSARKHLENALTEVRLVADSKVEAGILYQLIELQFNPKEDSLNYLKHYRNLSDSLFKAEYLIKIADAEKKYETALKDASIQLLSNRNNQAKYYIFLLILIILLLVSTSFLLLKNHKKNLEKIRQQKKLEEEKALNQQYKIEKVELELKHKHHELVSNALALGNLSSDLDELIGDLRPLAVKLRGINDRKNYNQILQSFKSKHIKPPLAEFETTFEAMYPNFHKNLSDKYPVLTPREIQVCAMIKLDLNSKQIAGIINISEKAVETNRYRIRKKMDLSAYQNLNSELKKI